MLVNLARAHVDAVHGREAPLRGLVAKEGHLLVEEVAVVADARHARSRRRHARAAERLAVGRDGRQGNQALGPGRLRRLDDWLEGDLRELVGELLLAEEIEQRGIALDGILVEVAADRDPALAGNLTDVVDDLVECPLTAAKRP